MSSTIHITNNNQTPGEGDVRFQETSSPAASQTNNLAAAIPSPTSAGEAPPLQNRVRPKDPVIAYLDSLPLHDISYELEVLDQVTELHPSITDKTVLKFFLRHYTDDPITRIPLITKDTISNLLETLSRATKLPDSTKKEILKCCTELCMPINRLHLLISLTEATALHSLIDDTVIEQLITSYHSNTTLLQDLNHATKLPDSIKKAIVEKLIEQHCARDPSLLQTLDQHTDLHRYINSATIEHLIMECAPSCFLNLLSYLNSCQNLKKFINSELHDINFNVVKVEDTKYLLENIKDRAFINNHKPNTITLAIITRLWLQNLNVRDFVLWKEGEITSLFTNMNRDLLPASLQASLSSFEEKALPALQLCYQQAYPQLKFTEVQADIEKQLFDHFTKNQKTTRLMAFID